jgi:hypothetical protein
VAAIVGHPETERNVDLGFRLARGGGLAFPDDADQTPSVGLALLHVLRVERLGDALV